MIWQKRFPLTGPAANSVNPAVKFGSAFRTFQTLEAPPSSSGRQKKTTKDKEAELQMPKRGTFNFVFFLFWKL